MTSPPPTTPETLLAHASWMRALAMGLVSDPHEADDVAQDATLAALRHPPPAGTALRPWLGTIVRHLVWRRWRAKRRRTDHEADASAPGSDGDDHIDTVERIDTQRWLLDAVRTLEEPLRTTVVQRYLEGRSSAEIARASCVPAGTVRARLKRGLDQLRERLDDEHGSRGAWMAIVVPLASRRSAPLAASQGLLAVSHFAQGPLLMSHFKIGLTCALAAIALIGGWKHAYPVVVQDVAGVEHAAEAVFPNPISGESLDTEQHVARSPVSSPPYPEPAVESVTASVSVETTPELLRGSLDARLVDEHGSPLPGAEVILLRLVGPLRDPEVLSQSRADANGLAKVSVELPRYALPEDGGVAAASFELLARFPLRATHRQAVVVQGNRVTHLGDVVLGPGVQVSGQVVDERGVSVAGARVGVVAAGEFETHGPDDLARIARVGSDRFDFLNTETSRADGAFDLAGLSSSPMRVWAHVPGKRFGLSNPVEPHHFQDPLDIEIVLADFQRGDRVRGQVVGPDGVGRQAWLGRMIRAGKNSTGDEVSTDAEGRFAFEVEYLEAVYDLTATDPLQEFARVQVRDIHPGDEKVLIEFRRGERMLIHLRDELGEPVLDAKISVGIDGRYGETSAESPEPGDYAIERPIGRFALQAEAPGFRELFGGRFEDTTAPAELDLLMERTLVVHGVVLAGGTPVEGAIVEAFQFDTDGRLTVNGLRCQVSSFECGEARTDAGGRFELHVDAEDDFVVRARHVDWVDAELGPLTADMASQPLELEFSRGGTIEGIVRVAADRSPGGIVVAVHRSDGRPRSVRTAADGSFRLEKLMAGQWRVFSLDEDINPHRRSFSSYKGDEPILWDCQVRIGRTTKFDLDLTLR